MFFALVLTSFIAHAAPETPAISGAAVVEGEDISCAVAAHRLSYQLMRSKQQLALAKSLESRAPSSSLIRDLNRLSKISTLDWLRSSRRRIVATWPLSVTTWSSIDLSVADLKWTASSLPPGVTIDTAPTSLTLTYETNAADACFGPQDVELTLTAEDGSTITMRAKLAR